MRFSEYCSDKWVSIFIFAVVLTAGGSLLLLIDTPIAVACVVEAFYAAGFFIIFIQDYFKRKGFYDELGDAAGNLDEICYLTELLEEPGFQEGRILYDILRRDEKYLNDTIAGQQRELQEYKDYVELWVHEVKTPIAVSRLIVENNRNEVTKSLEQEMDKLESFVDQMLYYSKSSSLQDDYHIRPVSLKGLVTDAVREQAKFMISNKVTPRIGVSDEMVLTDPKWMKFVLRQIISNSVKYHSKERKPELVFSTVKDGNILRLSIADNGIGMPPEDTERALRKGFTGANGRKYPKSTGMGLYLCDMLCKKLGTELTLQSEEGEGTVVTLSLIAAVDKDNISKM